MGSSCGSDRHRRIDAGGAVPAASAGSAEVAPLRIQWTGIATAVVAGAWTAVVVFLFSSALAGVNGWLAAVMNVVVVGGLAPAVQSWRAKPALRFLALGMGFGVAAGWIALLVAALAV